MLKLDLRKELKSLYAASAKRAEIVVVPAFSFALVDGGFSPGEAPDTSPAFAAAIGALYGVSYTLKFMSKQREVDPIDYTVMALEALWWVEDGQWSMERKDNWKWTAMILQPDHITPEMFADAVKKAGAKRPNPALEQIRLDCWQEGTCVQMMHVGPYASEPATVERMDTFAAEQGYTQSGKHHEIYLGDPMRSAPEKLKTILRHPVKKIT